MDSIFIIATVNPLLSSWVFDRPINVYYDTHLEV